LAKILLPNIFPIFKLLSHIKILSTIDQHVRYHILAAVCLSLSCFIRYLCARWLIMV